TIKNANAKQQVHVLNNPFKNNIIVRFERVPLGKVILLLTDLSGKKIKVNELPSVNSQLYQWDLGQLPVSRGIYILTAEVDRRKYSIQLLKQ
ncbi:MAG: T9SS type A sorting domain-containing protein, partial [Ginsengibacter sp.]